MCAPCLAAVSLPNPLSSCLHCGKRSQDQQQPCSTCRVHPPAYDSARSWALYLGTARRLIHLLKYEQVLPLGPYLARQLYQLPLPEFDVIVPVPLGRMRRRQRGYNQAEEIARGLARLRGVKCAPQWLRRKKETRSQAGLGIAEREQNVQDAFSSPRTGALNGKRILLVDDVLTTGATVRAAAAALKASGALAVHVVTVARADLEHDLSPGPKPATTDLDWGPNPWRSIPWRQTSS